MEDSEKYYMALVLVFVYSALPDVSGLVDLYGYLMFGLVILLAVTLLLIALDGLTNDVVSVNVKYLFWTSILLFVVLIMLVALVGPPVNLAL